MRGRGVVIDGSEVRVAWVDGDLWLGMGLGEGSFTLGFAQGFDVGPKVGEGGGDLFMAGGEVFVERFFGGGEAFVEVEGLDLEGEAALNVFEGEIAGCGMAGIDDIEEVGVGVGGEEGEGGGLAPLVEEVGVEVCDGVAFYGW